MSRKSMSRQFGLPDTGGTCTRACRGDYLADALLAGLARESSGRAYVYDGGGPLPERQLIARIRKMGGRKSLIGDDCAVLAPPRGHELLVTTDLCLEGVHFRRDSHPAGSGGHRCLARGLSDIGAMAGEPLACFLSLGLPAELPQEWVDEFFEGFLRLAKRFRVPLAGGDTAESPQGVIADVTVVGSAPRGKAVRRSGAKPEDFIYVTGALGGAAATLARLRRGRVKVARSDPHFYPEPRVAVAR